MTLPLTRRTVLRGLGSAAALQLAGWPRGASAAAPDRSRLVVILLRGGLDGLAAVPAVGDPDFLTARAGLGESASQAGPLSPLDDVFALDARLSTLADWYARRELAVVHAVALPYRERSHFDAQNLMESGGTKPFALQTGWAGRALAQVDAGGIGLQPVTPLVLRGHSASGSWSPSSLPAPAAGLVARAHTLFQGRDPALAHALGQAEESRRILQGETAAFGGEDSFPALAAAAGAFLGHPSGPRVAVLELGGFDSHSLQALQNGGLDRPLRAWNAGLRVLRRRLGPAWRSTVVVATTEFGRTVAMNGSGGTDHGTASAAFVAGGAVAGGRVIADWPGLAAASLHEGRDLRPTRDLRSVWKGVLRDHLRIAESRLDGDVFPDSATVSPLDGLLRG